MRHLTAYNVAAALLTLTAGLFALSPAHATPPSKVIYEGESATTAGIKLGGWGSGNATESKQTGYAGQPAAIKLLTHGFYAGGRILFDKPVDLTEQFTDPDSRYGFLEFIVQFPGLGAGNTQPGFGPGGFGPGGFPGGFGPGGPGGPGPGGFGDFGSRTVTPTGSTKALRVLLTFAGGMAEATNVPVVLRPAGEEGWFSMAIPFVSFKGFDKVKQYQLKEIRVFGDGQDEMTVGAIKTTSDDEPISIEPLEADISVAVNDPVEFTAVASAGISTLKYSWDFDASDGIQEDATGTSVVHNFRKASPRSTRNMDALEPYIVTLTVSDVSGAKKPEIKTTMVTVNE